MTARLVKACTAAALILVAGHPAAAQTSRLEVSGGYAPARVLDQTFPAGWSAAVAANLTRSWSVVAEVDGAYRALRDADLGTDVKLSTHGIAGGAKWSIRMARIVPFVQIVAGAARVSAHATVLDRRVGDSVTKFTLQPGGGVDLRVHDRLGVVGHLNYRRLFFDEADVRSGENQLRAVVGIRLSL